MNKETTLSYFYDDRNNLTLIFKKIRMSRNYMLKVSLVGEKCVVWKVQTLVLHLG